MKKKYCYFLIWGNGIQYSEKIINQIRNDKNFKIVLIKYHEVEDINKFVKQIYSVDYAPLSHLKAKIKYLLNSNPQVMIIFAINKNHQEKIFGEGGFRHIECEYVKNFKENIRNKFNPIKNGIRTHEHVIHASDSEYQADYLLKKLGYIDGIKHLSKKPNSILPTPYHLKPFDKFVIKKIDIDSIYCNVIYGNKKDFALKKTDLVNTPHYKCLNGDTLSYEKYIKSFSGYILTDDHYPENYKLLEKDFLYLDKKNQLNYIIIKEFQLNNYLILDGVHRASILKKQGYKKIIVAIIKD